MVGIVAGALLIAAILFGVVVNAANRASAAEASARRPVIPPISHPVNESMADCVRCHVAGQGGGMPASHNTYGAGTCLTCHQVAAPAAAAPAEQAAQPSGEAKPAPVPHPVVEPYANCLACHVIGGNLSMPANHAAYGGETCTGCHAGPSAEGAAGATTGGVGPVVPHDVAGQFVNCDSCHAFGNGQLAMPDNHQGFTKETCTNCHQPAR
jgi:hypothetical protein